MGPTIFSFGLLWFFAIVCIFWAEKVFISYFPTTSPCPSSVVTGSSGTFKHLGSQNFSALCMKEKKKWRKIDIPISFSSALTQLWDSNYIRGPFPSPDDIYLIMSNVKREACLQGFI